MAGGQPGAGRPGETPEDPAARRRLYVSFARVLAVQLAALLALWWLQSRFGSF